MKDPGSAPADHFGADIQTTDIDATDNPLVTVNIDQSNGDGLIESQVR
jgi:hypothetical protein